jgi:hypothetical protein
LECRRAGGFTRGIRMASTGPSATATPLRCVRSEPRGVFEDLPGFLRQGTRLQHVPGTGSQEVWRIEAGCALDQRWDSGVLEHAFHQRCDRFVRGRGHFYPTLGRACILPRLFTEARRNSVLGRWLLTTLTLMWRTDREQRSPPSLNLLEAGVLGIQRSAVDCYWAVEHRRFRSKR